MMSDNITQPETYEIDPRTHLGRVHYTVADLERMVSFYRELLGFRLLWREGDTAALGAGERGTFTPHSGGWRHKGTQDHRTLSYGLLGAFPVGVGPTPTPDHGDQHTDPRTLQSWDPSGDLPARPRRKRHRVGMGFPTGRMADERRTVRPQSRRRGAGSTCAPSWPSSIRIRHHGKACTPTPWSATSTFTSQTSARRKSFTTERSASASR